MTPSDGQARSTEDLLAATRRRGRELRRRRSSLRIAAPLAAIAVAAAITTPLLVGGQDGVQVTTTAPAGAVSCPTTPLETSPVPGPPAGFTGRADLPWLQAAPTRAGVLAVLFYSHGRSSAVGTRGRMPTAPDGARASSTKVLWVVQHPADTGASHALLRGIELSGTERFTQTLGPAGAAGQYPSIIDIPSPGCWQIQFSAGTRRATIVVLAVAS